MSIQTFLIEDPRISKSAINDVTVGVKSGPASSTVQKYQPNSNSSTNVLWNVNVPSENTLVDRHIYIEGKLQFIMTTPNDSSGVTKFGFAPSAFPFNSMLQSASLMINNSKVTVQSQDILSVVTKQMHQKYLSQHFQGTAHYVDKYFANMSDATALNGQSNPLSGFSMSEKDSDTLGRGSARLTVAQQIVNGVSVPVTISNGVISLESNANYFVSIEFNEPIIGLPSTSLSENDGCYTGLNQLELSVQFLSNFKKAFNMGYIDPAQTDAIPISGITFSAGSAASTDSNLLSNASKLCFRYYSLHPSQYAKMSKKSVIPFDEMIAYKTPFYGITANQQETNVISLRQIPDKLYIFMKNRNDNAQLDLSHNLVVPITGLTVNFNNVAGLLSEMNQYDLYLMSRRNGSQQTFEEFIGLSGTTCSLGSYVVVDCTRDLGLDDMLSASSLGQFSLQIKVAWEPIKNDAIWESYAGTASSLLPMDLIVVANYGGILVTEQGSSSVMSGLLTKQAVIDAKSKGSSNIDYEDVAKVSGGSLFKQGKAEVGRMLKSERGRIAKAVDARVDGAVDAVAARGKQEGHSRLAKYY